MPQDPIEQFLKRPVRKRKPVSIDEFLKTPVIEQPQPPVAPTPPVEAPGFFENIGIGLERGATKVGQAALSVAEYFQGAQRGDIQPGVEMAELALRGLAVPVNALLGSENEIATALSDPAALQAAQQRRETRQTTQAPLREGFQAAKRRLARADVRAGLDPSITGKITRGVSEGAVLAAPAIATGIATGGSVPALATLGALQSAGQPENLGLNVALEAAPIPAGRAVAPILRRIRGGRGAAVTPDIPPIQAEAPIPATQAAQAIPTPATVAQPVDALQSAFGKLGTDNIDQIGAMIASSNRRFNKTISGPGLKKRPLTPEETQRAIDDYNIVKQLTPDEERALSQVLPARTVSPVREDFAGGGSPSRDISDIPNVEANAQLDANLRELEDFFGNMGRQAELTVPATVRAPIGERMAAIARTPTSPVSMRELRGQFPDLTKQQFDDEMIRLSDAGEISLMRHDFPASLSAVQKENMVRRGSDYYTAATRTGPRVGKTAALEVADPTLVKPQERTKVLETISALRKAGLLTGIKTHIRNVVGTGTFQLSEELARIPASMIDLALSVFTKRRTVTGPSLGAIGRSAHEAATKGVKEAWDIVKRGISETDLERLGLPQPINSGSKVLDTYINGTFRLLNAEDRVFKTFALRRALEDRARSVALTEIRQRTIARGEYGRRVRELLNSPPDDLAAAAAADAEIAVFTNPNKLANAVHAGKEQIGQVGKFGADLVFPFVQTPTNVIARMLEYAGAKVPYHLVRAAVKRSFTDAEQRAFAQTFGRAGIGAGLITLGYRGYKDGWLTGLMEDDPTRRARDLAAGRTPGSVKVGNRWHQLTGFAPLGSLLTIGATLAREGDQEGMLAAAPETALEAFMQQPLLSGTEQIIKAAREPGTAGGRFLGGIAGSFVPTIVGDLGEAIDPSARQATDLTGRVIQRIPGARETLPEATDVLGQPRQDFGPGQAFLDPTRATTDVDTPLFRELVRLDAGIAAFDKKPDEPEDQYQNRVQKFGQLYLQYGQQLVASPLYNRQPEDIQRRMLSELGERAKRLITTGKEKTAYANLSPITLLDAARRSAQNEAKRPK